MSEVQNPESLRDICKSALHHKYKEHWSMLDKDVVQKPLFKILTTEWLLCQKSLKHRSVYNTSISDCSHWSESDMFVAEIMIVINLNWKIPLL